MPSEDILLYEPDWIEDIAVPASEPGRFEDIWILDTNLEGRTEEEKREVAISAAQRITREFVGKIVSEKSIPPSEKIAITIHPTDTAEQILVQVQKMKSYADRNDLNGFISTWAWWSENTKADLVAWLMSQLNATDTEDLKDRVSEITFTNDEYAKVTRFRDAFKMIRINKMIKHLQDRLASSPEEAMKMMVGLSTNIVSRKLHMKQWSFNRKDRGILKNTETRINNRIESVQDIVDEMKKTFEPFKSQFPLFIKVWNEYLKSLKIAAQIK